MVNKLIIGIFVVGSLAVFDLNAGQNHSSSRGRRVQGVTGSQSVQPFRSLDQAIASLPPTGQLPTSSVAATNVGQGSPLVGAEASKAATLVNVPALAGQSLEQDKAQSPDAASAARASSLTAQSVSSSVTAASLSRRSSLIGSQSATPQLPLDVAQQRQQAPVGSLANASAPVVQPLPQPSSAVNNNQRTMLIVAGLAACAWFKGAELVDLLRANGWLSPKTTEDEVAAQLVSDKVTAAVEAAAVVDPVKK